MNEITDNFNGIQELTNEELDEMSFYETALYIQTLNKMEKLYDEMNGDSNE